MSQYRYWWYDYVQKSIKHSMDRINSGTEPATLQEAQAQFATRKALEELKNKDSAQEREEFIKSVFCNKNTLFLGLLCKCTFQNQPPVIGNRTLFIKWPFSWASCRSTSSPAAPLGFMARGRFCCLETKLL